MSLLDTREKKPIEMGTLFANGFKYVANEKGNCFELQCRVLGRKTWMIRYWPRGAEFEGKKLRSNRLVYKHFHKIKEGAYNPHPRNLRLIPINNYKKYVLRNVGEEELIMTGVACGSWLKEAFY